MSLLFGSVRVRWTMPFEGLFFGGVQAEIALNDVGYAGRWQQAALLCCER